MMTSGIRAAAFAVLCIALQVTASEPDRFARMSPAEAGYSEAKLQALGDFLQQSGSSSLLLLHDGKVFYQWGDIRQKVLVHSMRKALLSSLYGAHSGKKTLDLQQTLADLQIDDKPNSLTSSEKAARLIDLLQSRSGVYLPAAAEAESMTQQRPARGSHAPGTFYYYNNWDFNTAGYIYEKLSGKTIFDAFYHEIATPLGMLDFHNKISAWSPEQPLPAGDSDGFYQYETNRSQFPAYHFRMSAHDLALYGQLFLNGGRWQGKQIIPAEWITRSMQVYSMTEPDYGLGYGMLWGVMVPDSPTESPSFYHTGAGVHMLGVYPKHKLVMVHRVNTEQDYRFNDGDLYRVIRMMHGARLKPADGANDGAKQ